MGSNGHGCEAVVDNQSGSFTWLNRTGFSWHISTALPTEIPEGPHDS